MGVNGVENKMGSSCGIWGLTLKFSNGKTNPITKPHGVVYYDVGS
jgi:hypothetical protein